MNQVFGFGTFILGVATIIVFLVGVFTTNTGLVLAGWILAIAFFVILFHAAPTKENHK